MSLWKTDAAKRRAVRNVKGPEEIPKSRSNRKDKRRWCRGKPGIPHKPECVDYNAAKNRLSGDYAYNRDARLLVCTECGKELDRYCPFSYTVLERDGTRREVPPKPPPSWVVK